MTKAVSKSPMARRQSGAALAVSLILLVIMTMLGVNSMMGTSMEERMAANIQDNQQAFNAAETGLTQAFEDGTAFDLTTTVTQTATEIASSGTYSSYETEFRGWSKPPIGSLYSATTFSAAHFDIESTGSTGGGASAELHGGAYQIAPKSN